MSEHQIIVVDVETNGLDPRVHVAVEVAWHNLSTGRSGHFIPPHDPSEVLRTASIEALRINRYIDRIPDKPQDTDGVGGNALARNLEGGRLAACNPAFDSAFLLKMFRDYEDREIGHVPNWHYRMLDLSSYAAALLGRPGDMPGLADICAQLQVVNDLPHTAAWDVAATAECFRRLFRIAEVVNCAPRAVPGVADTASATDILHTETMRPAASAEVV